MTSNTSPGAAGYGINDIWEAAKRDDKASLELEARIDKMRQDIDAGLKLPEKKIDLMESSNRDMTKELGRLIEQILAQGDPTPTDRQMLQALHGRLFECDRRTSLLVKLREVESQGRGERYREFLEGEKSGLGARGKSIPVPLPSSSRSPVKVQKGEPTLKTSIRALMERADPSNTGALQLVVPGHPEIAEYESSDESRSSNGGSGSGTDAESDHAGWPLVYCVLNINPSTPKGNLETGAKKALARLRMKHDPTRVPNDPEAPRRWEAIMKAYNTLTDPERKKFYDMHGREPAELKWLDLSKLSI